MNEVETFARVGERAGAAVGSGVRTARQAGASVQSTLAERASQAQDVLAERWGPALDALAERLNEVRHELATRIEPEPPRRRRRWPWLALLLLVVAGVASAAVLARRPRETEPDVFTATDREPGSRDSDPDAGWNSPAGNGAIGVERPSASTD
ncbi:MAG TPA: hypothetical protein VFQ77_01535 [Pseudonocardiaceae bacterium]|nr:hypothetical protein [Pseudonocardiaceae bacterium]